MVWKWVNFLVNDAIMHREDLTIIIKFDSVIIRGVPLPTAPRCDELLTLLSPDKSREYQKAPAYLPTFILDDLGLVIRYKMETRTVALVDVHFAAGTKT